MQGRLLFCFAVLIGVFSYFIFVLGIFHQINILNVGLVLCLFMISSAYLLATNHESLESILKQAKKNFLLFYIFLLFLLVNLIGALGPELGFDALWYHLVLPKIYINSGYIGFIEGGLLYYSLMPKLVDFLYVPALLFADESAAKVVHLLFGVLTAIVTYKISNLFVSKKLSYLAAIIFYSNLVVSWMSITAYIDLGRAFFSALGVYFFLMYLKFGKKSYLLSSSFLIGLEASSKLIGISTLVSLVLVYIIYFGKKSKAWDLLIILLPPLLLLTPWVLFSYAYTKSFFYPFFTPIYPSGLSMESFNILLILKDTINLMLFSPDPVTPIYFVSLPFIFAYYKKMPSLVKTVVLIFSINILIWNFLPQKSSRFVISYLPLMSAVTVWIFSRMEVRIKRLFYVFIFAVIVVNLIYRGVANYKYIPVLIGLESKEEFLIRNLNFAFGDYYDANNSVKEIVGEQKVLVKGVHNLYYANFKFDHESWAKGKYRYILSNEELTDVTGYNLIYKNEITNTYLYESTE